MIGLRPELADDARAVMAEPANLMFNLRFYAYFAAAAFAGLNIYLIVMRTRRFCARAGLCHGPLPSWGPFWVWASIT